MVGLSEVEDLVVAAKPEGIDETKGELDGLQQSLDESAESMGDTASEMGDIQSKWQGAMNALVTGLAVATAGLLSKVPVLGEAFGGLLAVVEAVAYHMDQVLRPVLEPITNGLFDLSDAIYEAEGPLGTLLGVLGTATAIFFAVVLPLAKLIAMFSSLGGTWAVLVAGAKLLGGAIMTLVGILSSPIVIIGALIVVLGLLAWYFRDEIVSATNTLIDGIIRLGQWFGDLLVKIGEFSVEAARKIAEFVANGLKKLGSLAAKGARKAATFASNVLSAFATLAVNVAEEVAGLVSDVAEAFTGLVTDAADYGEDLVMNFVTAISDFLWEVGNVADDLVENVSSPVNDLIDSAYGWGSDLIDELVEGIRDGLDDLRDAAEDAAGAVDSYLPSSPADTGPLSDLDDSGPGLIDEFAGGIEANVGRMERAGRAAAKATDEGASVPFSAGGSGSGDIYLDGKKINQNQARYRDDGVSRRGR